MKVSSEKVMALCMHMNKWLHGYFVKGNRRRKLPSGKINRGSPYTADKWRYLRCGSERFCYSGSGTGKARNMLVIVLEPGSKGIEKPRQQ